MVAEITNTPWNERHAYVLPVQGTGHLDLQAERRNSGVRFEFGKEFHVSPFMPLAQRYHWWFETPGSRLNVQMQNRQCGRRMFDATLCLRRRELTSSTLASALARHPWMSLKVITAIYFEAARLRLKRAPFFEHPGAERPTTEPERPGPAALSQTHSNCNSFASGTGQRACPSQRLVAPQESL